MAHKNITIIRDDENPETTLDILAESIVNIKQSIERLESTQINRKTLVRLIQMNCNANPRPTIDTIETILLSLNTLKKNFLKK